MLIVIRASEERQSWRKLSNRLPTDLSCGSPRGSETRLMGPPLHSHKPCLRPRRETQCGCLSGAVMAEKWEQEPAGEEGTEKEGEGQRRSRGQWRQVLKPRTASELWHIYHSFPACPLSPHTYREPRTPAPGTS